MAEPGLSRLRVRCHVPVGNAPAPRRAAWRPRPGDPALLLHVLADEQDRAVLATSREVIYSAAGAITVGERIFAVADHVEEFAPPVAGERPDVPAGLGTGPLEVGDLETLGRLITNRSYRQRWPLVGADLPWVLGRLAAYTGPALGGRNGLSIAPAGTGITNSEGQWVQSWNHPRLIAVSHGAGINGAHLRWGSVKNPEARTRIRRQARFVDLLILAGALCGAELESPAQGARVFGVDWPTGITDLVARLRAEAGALARLYGALLSALAEAAPGLHPADTYSFGSVATHILRRGNVHAPLSKAVRVPARNLGAAASASFGGWFECRLPGVALPMALVDVRKTYASVFSLLGLTGVYGGGTIRSVERDSGELLGLLTAVAAGGEQLWDPATWSSWGLTFVTLRPHGEVLPTQVQDPTGGWRTAVAPLDLAGGSATFHWADVAAAVIAGANSAALGIERVFSLTPSGHQDHLTPLRLPTGRLVDLQTEDLGAVLAAEANRSDLPRWQSGLAKAVGNALTFGVLARADRKSTPTPVEVTAVGPGGEQLVTSTRHPEVPGPHTFLPASAAVCAGARLLMRLAHALVEAAGGAVVATHADSLAIPCSVAGGWAEVPGAPADRLRILPRAKLDGILARFAPLGIAWKYEVAGAPRRPVVGLAVGVNRVIFAEPARSGAYRVVRSSDAGLGGHLADPSDDPGAREPDGRHTWAAALEGVLLATVAGAEVDPARSLSAVLDPDLLPIWTRRPVVRRYAARDWSGLAALRRETGDFGIGPFARYLRADTGRPGGPVALGPWPDPRQWERAAWRLGGAPVGLDGIGTDGLQMFAGPGRGQRIVVRLASAYFSTWARSADPSLTGPLRGLRTPVPIRSAPGLMIVVGKDGTELMSGDDDPAVRGADPRLTYGRVGDDSLRERARTAGLHQLSRQTGLPFETVRRWAAGGGLSAERLATIVAALDVLEAQPAAAPLRCLLCGQPSRGRWCSGRCRMIAVRADRKAAARAQWIFPLPERGWYCQLCGRRFQAEPAAFGHRCPVLPLLEAGESP